MSGAIRACYGSMSEGVHAGYLPLADFQVRLPCAKQLQRRNEQPVHAWLI